MICEDRYGVFPKKSSTCIKPNLKVHLHYPVAMCVIYNYNQPRSLKDTTQFLLYIGTRTRNVRSLIVGLFISLFN